MNEFEAYQIYLSLRSHLTRKNYDAFKYRFKTNASVETFRKRKDAAIFKALSGRWSRRDYMGFVISNLIAGNSWIGAMSEEVFRSWDARIGALFYNFSKEMKAFWGNHGPDFDLAFVGTETKPSILSREILGERVSLETAGCLHKMIDINNVNGDPLAWGEKQLLISKYADFLEIDQKKFRDEMTKILSV